MKSHFPRKYGKILIQKSSQGLSKSLMVSEGGNRTGRAEKDLGELITEIRTLKCSREAQLDKIKSKKLGSGSQPWR